MTRVILTRLFAFALCVQSWGQGSRSPELSRGVISYFEPDGRRHQINVGKPCSDLWVSPDGGVIAFIAIQRAEPPTPAEREPFIEESRIYIAWRSDHFKPVPLQLKPVPLDGNLWAIFRNPSISPDLQTLYFLVPYTITTWKLMSSQLSGGSPKILADAMTYCVVWGGDHSGKLLTMVRQDEAPGREAEGVRYPCYLSGQSGGSSLLADGDSKSCFSFDDFVRRWSNDNKAVCRR